ncbi:MAG: thiamine-phosphate kinase [Microbacteriaceae bacterium]
MFQATVRDMTVAETLRSVGESATLERIFPRLPASSAQLLGPGDDAAVLAAPDGRYVVTTDMMIHGPDFRLAWSGPKDLGWKAASTNLSDVAAMGAVPTALVVAIAAPADTEVAFLEGIADGLRLACETLAPGCGVVGGDLSVSDTITIAVTAFGDLEGRSPILRSGARAGDVVAISGSVGAAAAGLALLFDRAVVDGVPDAAAAAALATEYPALIAAQLAPNPPIADGPAAALAGATAMLDVSDGLVLDARRIARASSVSIDLSSQAVLVAARASGTAVVSDDARTVGDDALRFALDGGEDHSLLATFPHGTVLPRGFQVIGEVVAATDAGLVLVDGCEYTAAGGWDPYAGWLGTGG